MSTAFLRMLAVCTALFGSASAGAVPFEPLNQTAFLRAHGGVDFAVEFNQAVDFTTRDEFGRPARSFQFYIVAEPGGPRLYDSLIRLEDAYHAQGLLVVRDEDGPAEPGSGGWGPARGTVPFRIDGALLIFSAPLSLLTDFPHEPLIYRLETFDYGSISSAVSSTVTPVPELGTPWLLGIGLFTLVRWRRRCGDQSWGFAKPR